MSEYAPVVLRCDAEINGMTIRVQQPVTQSLWAAAQTDQPYLDAIRAQLRAALAAAIAKALDPVITVHLPTELDEAVMQRAMDQLIDET